MNSHDSILNSFYFKSFTPSLNHIFSTSKMSTKQWPSLNNKLLSPCFLFPCWEKLSSESLLSHYYLSCLVSSVGPLQWWRMGRVFPFSVFSPSFGIYPSMETMSLVCQKSGQKELIPGQALHMVVCTDYLMQGSFQKTHCFFTSHIHLHSF